MHHLKILGAASILAAGLGAQAPVRTFPIGFDTTEANSSMSSPVWNITSARLQSQFTPKGTGLTTSFTLNGLRVRGNGTSSTGAAFTADIMIEVSSLGVDTTKPVYTDWNLQHGTDRTTFMKRVKVDFQAWSGTASPRPWDADFKGDAPFVITGTSLCIDIRGYTYDASGYESHTAPRDALSDSAWQGSYTTYGTGACPATFYNYSSGHYVGNTTSTGWYTYGYTRGTGDLAIAWLGVGQVNIDTGLLVGTDKCYFYSVPVFFHPVPVTTTEATGRCDFTWLTPTQLKDPALGGIKVTSQIVAIDPNLALKFSRGIEVTIGVGSTDMISRSGYSYGSATAPFDPDTGTCTYWSTICTVFGAY